MEDDNNSYYGNYRHFRKRYIYLYIHEICLLTNRYCIESTWRDPRLVNAVRAAHAPVYEPLQRDPPNCGNWYVYRSTLVDPLTTPCQYLTVPDVHKLRYLKGNYNTAEDWFD